MRIPPLLLSPFLLLLTLQWATAAPKIADQVITELNKKSPKPGVNPASIPNQ
ncbi:MAG: hypothetical protein QNL68_12950 [Akkermansiaceae bacterium]